MTVKTRFWLMCKRWRSRCKRGLGPAALVGTMMLLFRWAGWRGSEETWGYPIPFTDALPSAAIVAVATFIAYVILPRHHSDDDEP